MSQFTHTMIVGNKRGAISPTVLTVVENECLPQAVEILFNFFREYFEKAFAKDHINIMDFKNVARQKSAREAYQKAVSEEDWLGAIKAHNQSIEADYGFHFLPVKIDPDERDVMEAVVRRSWASKHFGMPEGPDKDAIQSAIDEERWEDAVQGFSKLNQSSI